MIELSRTLLKGWTVLVVDDEPDAIDIAQTLLEHYGATVLTAKNGQLGFEMAKTHRPKFIVSDLSMPIMDGWGMIDNLKKTVSTAEIPVIALTAHGAEGDRIRAMGAGFHNYLIKPLNPTTFIRDLLNLLLDLPELAKDLGISPTPSETPPALPIPVADGVTVDLSQLVTEGLSTGLQAGTPPQAVSETPPTS